MHVEGAACGDSNLSVKPNSSVKSDSKLPDTVDGNTKGNVTVIWMLNMQWSKGIDNANDNICIFFKKNNDIDLRVREPSWLEENTAHETNFCGPWE